MKSTILMFSAVCLLIVNPVFADLIRGIDMEFVTVGNAGNAPDTRGTVGCGTVAYDYRIGTHEVTNFQWNAFVTAAGAPTGEPAGFYDQSAQWTDPMQPVNNVSFYEAAQFCNYLTSGNKRQGAYQFGIDGSITIDRAWAISTYGTIYVIPTVQEWYKAAYYKPDGSGYSLYANGTDISPIAGVESNYSGAIGQPWDVCTGAMEQNGTFDMMGNVWELNETLFYDAGFGLRGGSYNYRDDYDVFLLSSSNCYVGSLEIEECNDLGFRVVSIVPEPFSIGLLGLGAMMVIIRKELK